jgi:pyrimidine/purine-5'-nucleotide nucleosidase
LDSSIVVPEFIDARVGPRGSLENLSQAEIGKLLDSGQGGLYPLFRRCALAVLNSGSGADTDNAKEIFDRYRDFEIKIVRHAWGIKLEMHNAPAAAFVDGQMIRGIKEHLFAVLRDVVFISNEIIDSGRFDLSDSADITNAVFHVVRNARLLDYKARPNLVVCWGGHSIGGTEYKYTKNVGYEIGLRALDVCTGCGPGAMKGPMKGATIGHAKQRLHKGRYLGISEPGIIAAESPNPIVNELVIMPDIEKRLEAFVRSGHGIVVFPGGAGTAEEILYILGILLHPDNADIPFPLVFTGPETSREYFVQINQFIHDTLGPEAQQRYKIIIDDPELVAREMQAGIRQVREFRKSRSDAYYFNWGLKIDPEFQHPFAPTHENMRNLSLHKNQAVHLLAANLRRAFSGVVAGNVKDEGIRAIEKFGHFEIHGDKEIMGPMDALLASFVAQHRMKLAGKQYTPCYRVIQ